MKKFVFGAAALTLTLGLASCNGDSTPGGKVIEEGGKVGFILPGTEGGETKAFKEHWQALAKEYGVEVVYENFQGQDPTYYKTCAEKLVAAGCDAIIWHFEMDGKDSVLEYCVDEEIYIAYSGSTVTDEVFDEYKDSPYFIGQIAPSPAEEQKQAYEMTKYFINLYWGTNKVDLPVGTTDKLAVWPVDYHGLSLAHQMTYRWKGIKQALEEFGATIKGDTDADAAKWTIEYSDTSVLKDKVLLMANNLADMNGLIKQCTGVFMQKPAAMVTTCNGNYLINMFATYGVLGQPTRFGTIDAFVSDYDKWYVADETAEKPAFKVAHDPYLVGKFAAINEAVLATTVKAMRGEAIRDNKNAVKIVQKYWTATDKATFDKACKASSGFTFGKKTFDDITSVSALQKLFDDATLDAISSKVK